MQANGATVVTFQLVRRKLRWFIQGFRPPGQQRLLNADDVINETIRARVLRHGELIEDGTVTYEQRDDPNGGDGSLGTPDSRTELKRVAYGVPAVDRDECQRQHRDGYRDGL